MLAHLMNLIMWSKGVYSNYQIALYRYYTFFFLILSVKIVLRKEIDRNLHPVHYLPKLCKKRLSYIFYVSSGKKNK